MLIRTLIAITFIITVSISTWAAPTTCPEHFAGGEAPNFVNQDAEIHLQPICYQQFAILHSSATRTPIWSAEHLTRERIEAAEGLPRKNPFHIEQALPPEDRSELADYKGSGYDRGHMAPNGDMPDPESQRESFTLANMIPQDPNNNRGLWAKLEGAVRDLVHSDGDIYVLTGPIFNRDDLQRLHNRVTVPSQLYKAVYDPARHAAGVYLTNNAPGPDWQVISLTELRNLTGVDAFPKLDQHLKDHAMVLPNPVKGFRTALQVPDETEVHDVFDGKRVRTY